MPGCWSGTRVPAGLCDRFPEKAVCQECPQPETDFSKSHLIDTRAILGGRTKNNSAAVIYLTCSFVNLCLRRINSYFDITCFFDIRFLFWDR